MKFWKHSALAAAFFLSLATTVTYTSCLHDSCKAVMCRQDGVCVDGFCQCPVGYEGTQCEIVSRNKFTGFYRGQTKVDGLPVNIDSAEVYPDPASVSENIRTVEAFIYSRLPERIQGAVDADGNEIEVKESEGRTVVFKYIGEERIEILIDELIDGKHVITNFQGTKSKAVTGR